MAETGPSLADTGKGYTLRYKNRFLYSSRNPKAGPETIALNIEILKSTLVFAPSPLLFYGLDKLLNKLPEDCHILCVEADQGLMEISAARIPPEVSRELQGVSPRVSLIRAADAASIGEYVRGLQVRRFRRARKVVLNAGYGINAPAYDAQFSTIEWVIRSYWQNRMTLLHMAPLWFSNLFKNLSLLKESYTIPEPSDDMTVVFAGAGESLDDAADFIRRERARVFLLCADTALPALCARGLYPDGVVALEAQIHNAGDFIGCLHAPPVLFADIVSHPGVLRAYSGKIVFISSAFAETSLFHRLTREGILPLSIPSLGSVGVAGLSVASQLTRGRIIFTGLDFSYTLGKPHARGAPTHIKRLSECRRLKSPISYAESMARRPFRIVNRMNKTVFTDLILQSYVENLNVLCGASERFFDLGRRGLPNRARSISPDWELSGCGAVNLKLSKSKATVEKNTDFLKLETARLEEFLDADLSSPSFAHKLEGLDYIYLHFPEYPDLDLTNLGTVKRLHQAASFYYRCIRRLTHQRS